MRSSDYGFVSSACLAFFQNMSKNVRGARSRSTVALIVRSRIGRDIGRLVEALETLRKVSKPWLLSVFDPSTVFLSLSPAGWLRRDTIIERDFCYFLAYHSAKDYMLQNYPPPPSPKERMGESLLVIQHKIPIDVKRMTVDAFRKSELGKGMGDSVEFENGGSCPLIVSVFKNGENDWNKRVYFLWEYKDGELVYRFGA